MSAGVGEGASLLRGVGEFEAGQARGRLFNANEDIARRQFQSEAEAGAYNENMVRMRGAALEGQQVAQIGSSNLQQTGTPAQVVAGSRMVNEMDALQTRNNALRRAWGFEVQGESDAFQANQVRRAGAMNGFGSILAGSGAAYKEASETGSWF